MSDIFETAIVIAPDGENLGAPTGILFNQGEMGLIEAMIGAEVFTTTHRGRIALAMVSNGQLYLHACPIHTKDEWTALEAMGLEL